MQPYEIAGLLSAWAFKVIWEIIALPVTVPFVKYLKRVEQEDFYDTKTDFNPLRIMRK